MTTLDCSNYSSPLTPTGLEEAELVIVQCIDPPPGYPAGQTRRQLADAQGAGVPTDIYFYLFPGQSDAAILRQLCLADGFPIRKKWLDIEELGLSVKYIAHVLALMDGYPSLFPSTGIYCAAWWVAQNPGVLNNFSATRQLWAAQYDGIEDASIFQQFAGWSECRIKQHIGTSTWNGITGIDLDCLSTLELADLIPVTPEVEPVAIHVGQGLQDRMTANGDAPLCDHVTYNQVDEDGVVYSVEKCWGQKGLYISSNAGGAWVNAGPM